MKDYKYWMKGGDIAANNVNVNRAEMHSVK
jgi:hypothetical protein